MAPRSSFVVAALLTACSSVSEGEAEEPPRAPITTSAPLPDPSGQAPPPVLWAGFEPASPDCNGWIAEGAHSIRSVPPRSGSYACKLCADGSLDGIALARDVGALEAGRYVMTAWIRKRPQNAAPAAIVATLEAATRGGRVVGGAPSTVVRDEWARLEATLDVPDGATSARVWIGAPSAASSECVLVDDVTIARAR